MTPALWALAGFAAGLLTAAGVWVWAFAQVDADVTRDHWGQP